VETGERMQRTAMMAGRQIGRADDRKRRGGQHGLGRCAVAQLFQCAVNNFGGWGLLDELDQRFDSFWILHALMHSWTPRRRCVCVDAGGGWRLALPCSASGCLRRRQREGLNTFAISPMVGLEGRGVNLR
jgi:hypothetical protein